MGVPVLFVPFRGSRVTAKLVLLKRKLEAIWHNKERNELLVVIAEKASRKPRKLLREYGVEQSAVHWPDRVRQRVVILVEGVEHAERLQRLLPAWEVRHAVPSEREPDDVEEDVNEPLPAGVIATLMCAARNGTRCDVLIRATGHTGRLGWDCITGVGGVNTAPLLVIDVFDLFDERSQADAEVRRQEYRQQGLEILERKEVKQNT